MELSNLKQKAIKGVFWSFLERFGSLAILFSSNIVLARLLTPQHYGLIGMLMVFITVSAILIDGGFGSALIQRKEPTNEDYSTIFWINISIATICYLILFSTAQLIADFYNQESLEILIKVLGIMLIIDAFGTVQINILVKQLIFKKITKIKISVAFLSSLAAIIAALCGLGVWSLVIQYIANSTFKSMFLWVGTTWHPSFIFSKDSLKTLFGFGSKLLVAGLISEIYRNFQILIIGKLFPVKEVGYFTQAKQLETVPSNTISAVVNQVTYPVFSQLQDNKGDLVAGISRCVKIVAFFNIPTMVLLAVIAKPLLIMLYSEKWLPSVPYFQWLCIGFGLLLVIHTTNLNALKSVGRSEVVLYLEIIKKILGLSFIFLFVKYGAIGIMWALALNSYIEFFLNGFFTGKYVGYGIWKQMQHIVPILFISFISGLVAYSLTYIPSIHYIILLILQIIIFVFMYIGISYLFKMETFKYLLCELERLKKNR